MTIGHVGDPCCPALTDRWSWLPCDHQTCVRRGGCYLVTIGHVGDPCCPVLTAGEEVVLVCPGEGKVSQL
jgi:hypothetical protein